MYYLKQDHKGKLDGEYSPVLQRKPVVTLWHLSTEPAVTITSTIINHSRLQAVLVAMRTRHVYVSCNSLLPLTDRWSLFWSKHQYEEPALEDHYYSSNYGAEQSGIPFGYRTNCKLDCLWDFQTWNSTCWSQLYYSAGYRLRQWMVDTGTERRVEICLA